MALKKPKYKDLIFLVIVALFFIPQTRKPIQIFVNKGLALISPSTINSEKQKAIPSYNLILKDENGTIFNFETTKGKIVLVNFWATWCPPCIAEMTSMQKLYKDYKDKVTFVFVSDESFNVVNPFLEKNNYTFKVYQPVTNYNNIFKVSSIPKTFLINQKGNVIIEKTGAANWNSNSVRNTINSLLATKNKI
ncbi:TlpA family protein disulfide reductase [Seonamhaeicola algicola]|uniref:TlpA family protein disulfide reductase n=1 Tax=Seonamhaeicola algicola TaxID=1719036 RepID=A0A5C7AF70_9FLAO|nr:TlpA disulfide reductase family protein [Seonamhaeicola algicola]TXE07061.1 TlpA family protein disulfide reductase [Seonamhaeicola algicola]